MMFKKWLLLLLLFCAVVFVSCGTEDTVILGDPCITSADCPIDGWLCESSVCVEPEVVDDGGDTLIDTGDTTPDDSGDTADTISDEDTGDTIVVDDDNGDTLIIPDTDNGDSVVDEDNGDTADSADDGDSGNTADTTPDEDIPLTCDPGFHPEAPETGDENGDGKIEGCVKNVGCSFDPPPCNNHGICTDVGLTAMCACRDEYDGRWCEDCADGYQDNNASGVCNLTCTAWEAEGNSCTGTQKCVDDAGAPACGCPVGYSGDNCEVCDIVLHCSNHASACSADTSGNRTCTCNTGYASADCSTCDSGYWMTGGNCVACTEGYTGVGCVDCASGYQNNNGSDPKQCRPDCSSDCGGSSGGLFPWDSHGSCTYDASNNASCVCDAGWVDLNQVGIFSCTPYPCAQCDIKNPLDPKGCDASCGKDSDTGEYDKCYKAGEKTNKVGSCYYDKNDSNCDPTGGSGFLNCGPDSCDTYCICNAGYTLDGDGKTCNPN